jgi:hypothetical protein
LYSLQLLLFPSSHCLLFNFLLCLQLLLHGIDMGKLICHIVGWGSQNT